MSNAMDGVIEALNGLRDEISQANLARTQAEADAERIRRDLDEMAAAARALISAVWPAGAYVNPDDITEARGRLQSAITKALP